MLKKIAIVGVLLVAGVGVFIAMQPSELYVERSGVVSGPVEVTFPLVNNLKNWSLWSPWDELDPDQKKTFSGPEAGKGAVTEWSGNEDVGKGRMTILESVPHEKIVLDLEFIEPFASRSTTTFRFAGEGAGKTRVTWSMGGTNDFMGKAMGLFMDVEEMIGKDFVKGLGMLDAAVQAEVARRGKEAEEARAAAALAAQDAAEDAADSDASAEPSDEATP